MTWTWLIRESVCVNIYKHHRLCPPTVKSTTGVFKIKWGHKRLQTAVFVPLKRGLVRTPGWHVAILMRLKFKMQQCGCILKKNVLKHSTQSQPQELLLNVYSSLTDPLVSFNMTIWHCNTIYSSNKTEKHNSFPLITAGIVCYHPAVD